MLNPPIKRPRMPLNRMVEHVAIIAPIVEELALDAGFLESKKLQELARGWAVKVAALGINVKDKVGLRLAYDEVAKLKLEPIGRHSFGGKILKSGVTVAQRHAIIPSQSSSSSPAWP